MGAAWAGHVMCEWAFMMLRIRFQLPPRTREIKGVKFAAPLYITTTTGYGEVGKVWGFSEADIYGLISSHNLKMEPACFAEMSATKYFLLLLLLFFLRKKIRLRNDFLPRKKYFISTAKAKQLRMRREMFVVYCEDETKHMNKTAGKKLRFFMSKDAVCASCHVFITELISSLLICPEGLQLCWRPENVFLNIVNFKHFYTLVWFRCSLLASSALTQIFVRTNK